MNEAGTRDGAERLSPLAPDLDADPSIDNEEAARSFRAFAERECDDANPPPAVAIPSADVPDMARGFAARLRAAARAVLPGRAFLRRDRGDGWYVTDAPRLDPAGGWIGALEKAGFRVLGADGEAVPADPSRFTGADAGGPCSDAPRLPGGAMKEVPSDDPLAMGTDAGKTDARSVDGPRVARIVPDDVWIGRLEALFPSSPDDLCASLARFAEKPPEPDVAALFTRGLRALDGARDAGYEKALRQSAAVCLRRGSGGGIYACALIAHLIKEAESHED